MIKVCIICWKEFKCNYPWQKCCSPECAKYKDKDYNKVYQKKYQLSYQQTDKYKQYMIRRRQSDEYKKVRKSYLESENGKNVIENYWGSKNGKLVRDKYRTSTLGKSTLARLDRQRRADENNIIETYTEEEWKKKVSNCKGLCPRCQRSFDNHGRKLTRDHIYSINRASKDFQRTGIKRVYTIDDMQPLCKSCNSIKHNKLIEVLKPKGLNTQFY